MDPWTKSDSSVAKLLFELKQELSKKIDDQSIIIRQQQIRLESQQDQLNNQRAIIEELAWQIRDLRDSVRKCSEQITTEHSQYHHKHPVNHTKLNIPAANKATQSNHIEDFSPIYESINFDAIIVARTNEAQKIKTATLRRQNAIESTESNKQNRNDERDIRAFLDKCIPPPPVTSPPHDTDSDTDLDPVQISSHTLEKLNSLYSLYKMRRSISNEVDELEDVVYRLREFNGCSSRPLRGSSKAMCSFVSNVEDDYLPRFDDEDDDDDDTAKFLAHEIPRRSANETNFEENCRREQTPIYTQNDEVYI